MGYDWTAVREVARAHGIDTDGDWWGLASWWEVFSLAEAEVVTAMNKPRPKAEEE